MSNSKLEIMNRIKSALDDRHSSEKPGDITIPRTYRRTAKLPIESLLNLFVERVADYKATVQVIDHGSVISSIENICSQKNLSKVVIDGSLSSDFRPSNVELFEDQPSQLLSYAELDSMDAVLTTCAVAVAETGTIALDAGDGQGRRVLSLIPDVHICIVKQEQIVEIIPEAFQMLKKSVEKEGRPITLISGPSATSDIELNRVEGVHGPRILEVLVVR